MGLEHNFLYVVRIVDGRLSDRREWLFQQYPAKILELILFLFPSHQTYLQSTRGLLRLNRY